MDPTLIVMNGHGRDDDTSDHELLEPDDGEFLQSLDKSNSDNSSFSSINDSSSTIEFLCYENKLLKENLAKSNATMKLAYKEFAAAKEVFDKKQLEFDEKCSEAKDIIAALRQEVLERDQLIAVCKDQGSTAATHVLEFESLHHQLAEMKNKVQLAFQERDDLKNKFFSLEMQYKSLFASSESQKKQDEHTANLMQKDITTLKMLQKKDDKEKRELNGSLSLLRQQFDELILEYEKLILDEKNRKAVLAAKESEIKHLQSTVEKLEAGIQQQQNMAEHYQTHFKAERQERQKLHNQCITLQAHLMRLSSPRDRPPGIPSGPSGPSSLNVQSRRNVCVCPKCGHEAPSIDALQQHCHSCGD